MTPKDDDSILQAVTYLASAQQPSGEFVSFSSPKDKSFTKEYTYHTTFVTSFILLALRDVPATPELNLIKQKAAAFLLKQKSSFWSWNYWKRTAQEAKTMPYPDDLDDTFCALAALFHYDARIIDGEVIAHVVQLLTATEARAGGPYRTWLVDKKASTKWKDVDFAVNCNIAYFLSLQKIETKQLSQFIEKAIQNASYDSPYYPSPIPLIYFLSRFYQGSQKDKIIESLLKYKQKNGSFGNPLLTALSISALLKLGYSLRKLTKSYLYLLKKHNNGEYKAYGFCIDPTRNNSTYVAGSPALTTAFCLEAINVYQQLIQLNKQEKQKKISLKKEHLLQKKLTSQIKKRLTSFSPSLKKHAKMFITQFLKKEVSQQILLLPYFFALSLGKKTKISTELLIKLGLANFWGWVAYTIYDDFLDNEGQTELLSLANVASREYIQIFETLLPKTDFVIYFRNVMDQLDEANTWEITYCRSKTTLPTYVNYNQLANKSFGHALGPIALLFASGYQTKSQAFKQVVSFFKHYLIARQLNDDAHDWEKDLAQEHINPVVSLILERSLKSQDKEVKEIFFNEILPLISHRILYHIKKAKRSLWHSSIIENPTPLDALLHPLENSAKKALEERKKTLQFLNTYGK